MTDKKIAVGVSGGADSLALVLMAAEELAVFGYQIAALTVDHRLRPGSAQEAQYVGRLMAEHNIEHHILVWDGEKPLSGIEDAARAARYDLMQQWCEENGVHVLMVAHHRRDQAETFLMRLQRGSGLEGLCCMREVSYWRDLLILRPLLDCSPEDLRNYLRKRGVQWVEDESNTDGRYMRNKMRAYLPELEHQTGISAQILAQTAARLQSAEEYMEQQVEQIMEQQVCRLSGGVSCIEYGDFLQWHREIKFRVLACLCRREYIPRAERVLNAVQKMNHLPFYGITLGGREIFAAYGKIWVVPERNAKRIASREKWKEFVLQNPQYAAKKIPHKARVAILESWNPKNV